MLTVVSRAPLPLGTLLPPAPSLPPAHSLLRGIGASAILGFASLLSGLALLPLVLTTVGAANYGVWLLLSALAAYLYQADLGMGSAVVHFLSRDRQDADGVAATVSGGFIWMTASGFVALPLYFLISATLVANTAHEAGMSDQTFQDLLTLGGVLTIALGLRVFPAILQGTGHWIYQRNTQLIGVAIKVVGTLVACLHFDSIQAVAIAEAIALVVPAILAMHKTWKQALLFLSPTHTSRAHLRTLYSYGIRTFSVGAMSAILLQADTLIVGAVVSAAAVSYYTAAFRLYMSVRQVLTWLTEPLLPALSGAFQTSADRARQAVVGLQFGTFWVGVGFSISLALAAPGLVSLWLGSEVPTTTVASCVIILLGGLTVNSIHVASIPAADAAGQPGAFLSLHALWCGLNVVLSVALGKQFGIVGIALGTTLPLLILEPFYLRRTADVLGISAGSWASSVLRPVLLFALVGATTATLTALALGTGLSDFGWCAVGASFGVGYLLATRALLRLLPMREITTAFQTRV